MHRAILLLVLVAACGGETATLAEPAPTLPFVSGSRLRADLLGPADAEVFLTWWDRELQTHCVLAPAEDGTIRCLPGLWTFASSAAGIFRQFNRADFSEGRDVGLRYLDAACNQPVHIHPVSEAPPPFVVGERLGLSCEPRFAMHRLGEPLETVATAFFRRRGDDCVPWSNPGHLVLYAIGDRVSADTFVAATFERVTWPSGLAAEVLAASDGAREVVRAYDTTRDAPCWAALYLGSSEGDCLPLYDDVAFIGFEHPEATCTEPVAYNREPDACEPPHLIIELDEPIQLASVGEHVPRSQVYRSDADSCQPVGDTDKRFFLPGAPPADETFPQLTHVDRGKGPVTAQDVADADGHAFRSWSLRAGGETCTPIITCDGVTRCATQTIVEPRLYANDQCTEPLATCDESTTQLLHLGRNEADCDPSARYGPLATIGDAYSGALFIRDDDGECVVKDDPVACAAFPGPLVDLETLPALKRRVE